MDITREKALQLWRDRHGHQSCVRDFAGRPIFIQDFDVKGQNRPCPDGGEGDLGWVFHRIFPRALGGSDDPGNLEIVHWKTHADAGERMVYSMEGETFRVKKMPNGWYGIYRDSDGERVDFHRQR